MTPPGFEVVFDHFRSFFDLASVMKNDPCIVFVLVLKFGDHRRWSEWRRVRRPLVARFGPKIIIFDYGRVGVRFG